jgi:hypothetical protein
VSLTSKGAAASRAIRFVVRMVARPRDLARWAVRVGALTLDWQFDEASPFPDLPDSMAARIASAQVILPAMDVAGPGNQDVSGLIFLVSTSKALDARRVFEIGTYNGLTALTLAMNLPSGQVHTLDLAPEQQPAFRLFPTDELHLPVAAPRVYDGRAEADQITQHLGDSADFDYSPFRNAIDVVYVDGAHSFEYVTNDSAQAFRMASPTSAIIWDDYRRSTPDVARALHSLAAPGTFRVPGTRLVVWFSPQAQSRLMGDRSAGA